MMVQACLMLNAFAAPETSGAKPLEPKPADSKPVDPTYILRANDAINLTIYQEPDLSGGVRILKTGQAIFPLIGSVQVTGMTVADAGKKIHDLYAAKYLVDPKVMLTVDSYASEFVSVLGAVRNPGQVVIPLSGRIDLATAMASAGGLAAEADRDAIQLTRGKGGVSTFSMEDIETGASGRVQLDSGDRIIVNKSRFIGKNITVLGPVGRPGPMDYPLGGKLDLVQAIAMAGGMTEMANPKKVTINRKGTILKVDFKEISQRGDRVYPILPGDVITVAERWL